MRPMLGWPLRGAGTLTEGTTRMTTTQAAWTCAVVATLWASAGLGAEGDDRLVREGKDEVLYLDGLANPKRWAPAECTLEASKTREPDGHPTLHMHIPVDHHAGEKAYPVGWPRAYLALQRPAETDWTAFERFEFMAYATMSRAKPPKDVINLQIQCPSKPRVHHRNLSEITLGKWVRVSVPTRTIKNVAEVARLGLNISESNYAHGDKLDFHFGGFRLVRAAEFGLAGLRVLSKAVFQGPRRLRVELDVVGPPQKVARGLPMALRQGKRVLRRDTLGVKVGRQVVELDVGALKLAPGRYTLVAFDAEAERSKSGTFRVVETPWPQCR